MVISALANPLSHFTLPQPLYRLLGIRETPVTPQPIIHVSDDTVYLQAQIGCHQAGILRRLVVCASHGDVRELSMSLTASGEEVVLRGQIPGRAAAALARKVSTHLAGVRVVLSLASAQSL